MILYISLGFMLGSLGKALQTAENSTFIPRQTSSQCQEADPAAWSVGSIDPWLAEEELWKRQNNSLGGKRNCRPGQSPCRPDWSEMCPKGGSVSLIKALSPAAAPPDCGQEAGFSLQTFTQPVFCLMAPCSDTLWGLGMSFFCDLGRGRWREELGDCGEVI